MSDLIQLEAITPQTERLLLDEIEQAMEGVHEASAILPGRSKVLRYGWDYDYADTWVDDFPAWLSEPLFPLASRDGVDNATINKYSVGKGISAHIDSEKFGEPIFILSLNSSASIIFRNPGQKPIKLFLPPRSLLRITGPLRTGWTHEIPAERTDTDGLGVRHDRKTRWSVVLRKKL